MFSLRKACILSIKFANRESLEWQIMWKYQLRTPGFQSYIGHQGKLGSEREDSNFPKVRRMQYIYSHVPVVCFSSNRTQKIKSNESKESHWAKHQVKHHYSAFIFCTPELIPFNYQLCYTHGKGFYVIVFCSAQSCSCSYSALQPWSAVHGF